MNLTSLKNCSDFIPVPAARSENRNNWNIFHHIVMSSSTGSTTSSQVDNSKTCAELINEDTLPNLRAYGLHNNDNIILPYVILFVTAMQIQGFLTELIELLDLCYHSSPFLVVLVALPHSFLKRKQSAGGKICYCSLCCIVERPANRP